MALMTLQGCGSHAIPFTEINAFEIVALGARLKEVRFLVNEC